LRALLLAAGLGTRLRPLTDSIPKCLVPIHGRPLLDYWLEMLTEAGVTPILVNLHYFADRVREYIAGSGYQNDALAVYEEDLLGTAGTLLKNRDFFGEEPIMLVHADNFSSFDVSLFIARHKARPAGCVITMMTFSTPTPESCGIVELDGDGIVQRFHEKVASPPGDLANGAVYILEPEIIDFLAGLSREVIDFSTEVLPHYLGRIYTFHNNTYHRDIGTMESYKKALGEYRRSPTMPNRRAYIVVNNDI
jgi:mannose-1-phosphate guanylyltransferase